MALPASIWSSPTTLEDVQPFRLGSGRRGCLLLHGFAGTPPEMRGLGEDLAANGYRAAAPLLAGHGETPQAMARTRWRDWAGSAQAALDDLRRECEAVFVGGQSLGGSLALYLAARNPDIRGVVAMGAMGSPRYFGDWRLRFIGGLKYLVRWYIPTADPDLGDPNALLSLHSYARRPTVCIESLMQFLTMLDQQLPQVRVPVLIMHGRHDRTVAVANAPHIFERIGSSDKQLVWFERSGHAITVDLERTEVYATARNWLNAR